MRASSGEGRGERDLINQLVTGLTPTASAKLGTLDVIRLLEHKTRHVVGDTTTSSYRVIRRSFPDLKVKTWQRGRAFPLQSRQIPPINCVDSDGCSKTPLTKHSLTEGIKATKRVILTESPVCEVMEVPKTISSRHQQDGRMSSGQPHVSEYTGVRLCHIPNRMDRRAEKQAYRRDLNTSTVDKHMCTDYYNPVVICTEQHIMRSKSPQPQSATPDQECEIGSEEWHERMHELLKGEQLQCNYVMKSEKCKRLTGLDYSLYPQRNNKGCIRRPRLQDVTKRNNEQAWMLGHDTIHAMHGFMKLVNEAEFFPEAHYQQGLVFPTLMSSNTNSIQRQLRIRNYNIAKSERARALIAEPQAGINIVDLNVRRWKNAAARASSYYKGRVWRQPRLIDVVERVMARSNSERRKNSMAAVAMLIYHLQRWVMRTSERVKDRENHLTNSKHPSKQVTRLRKPRVSSAPFLRTVYEEDENSGETDTTTIFDVILKVTNREQE